MCSPDKSPYCIEVGPHGGICDATELFLPEAEWHKIAAGYGPFWIQVIHEDAMQAQYLAAPPQDWSLKVLAFTAGEREAYNASPTGAGMPFAPAR